MFHSTYINYVALIALLLYHPLEDQVRRLNLVDVVKLPLYSDPTLPSGRAKLSILKERRERHLIGWVYKARSRRHRPQVDNRPLTGQPNTGRWDGGTRTLPIKRYKLLFADVDRISRSKSTG